MRIGVFSVWAILSACICIWAVAITSFLGVQLYDMHFDSFSAIPTSDANSIVAMATADCRRMTLALVGTNIIWAIWSVFLILGKRP